MATIVAKSVAAQAPTVIVSADASTSKASNLESPAGSLAGKNEDTAGTRSAIAPRIEVVDESNSDQKTYESDLAANPDLTDGRWKLSKIPEAIFHTSPDSSPEIRNIINALREQCKIEQASARSSNASTASLVKGSTSSRPNSSSDANSSTTNLSLLSTDGSPSKRILPKGKESATGNSDHLPEVTQQGEQNPKISRARRLKRLLKGKMPIRPSSFIHSFATASVECASCFDDVLASKAVSLHCTHHYCSECFVQLVQTAMQNENFWPPKCCLEVIPRLKIVKYLSNATLMEFTTKEREYAVPAKDRWYCTKPTCGLWFECTAVQNSVRCPHCAYEMCAYCRSAKHQNPREVCQQDEGRRKLDEEAALEGWRRCYACCKYMLNYLYSSHICQDDELTVQDQMVELKAGCRHITCRCKAEFCYTCGAKWKTCPCTEADQQRRKRELAAMRVKRQKEEEDLAAAIRAIAISERRERKRKILEAKKNMEAEIEARTESIKIRFAALREELKTLQQTQASLMHAEDESNILESQAKMETISVEQATLESSLEAEVGEYAAYLKKKSAAHVTEREETIARHTKQYKELRARLEKQKEDMLVPSVAASKHEVLLVTEQNMELNLLQAYQNKEAIRMEIHLEKIRRKPYWEEMRSSLRNEMQLAEIRVSELRKLAQSNSAWHYYARQKVGEILNTEEQMNLSENADSDQAVLANLARELEAIEVETNEADDDAARILKEQQQNFKVLPTAASSSSGTRSRGPRSAPSSQWSYMGSRGARLGAAMHSGI